MQVIVVELDGVQDGVRQRVQRLNGRNGDPAPYRPQRDLEDVCPLPESPLGDGQVVLPRGEVGLERRLQYAEGYLVLGFELQDVVPVAEELGLQQGQQCIPQRRPLDPFDAPALSRLGPAVPDR